jgi:hypothetical protein
VVTGVACIILGYRNLSSEADSIIRKQVNTSNCLYLSSIERSVTSAYSYLSNLKRSVTSAYSYSSNLKRSVTSVYSYLPNLKRSVTSALPMAL